MKPTVYNENNLSSFAVNKNTAGVMIKKQLLRGDTPPNLNDVATPLPRPPVFIRPYTDIIPIVCLT